MAEENKELPSPMNISPDAIIARFEARKQYRESSEGQRAAVHGRVERALRQQIREKPGAAEGATPREKISPQTEEILLRAAEAIGKVAEIQEKITRGEYGLELPEDHDRQLRYIRVILDGIENSNRDCHDWAISTVVKNTEAVLDRMFPDVAEEVRARLAVHDASELIKQAGGWIERKVEEVGPGYTIGSAATEAERRGHALTRKVVDVLLRRGLPGLKVREAWDLLQKANFDYKSFVEEVNRQRLNRGEEPFDMEREGFELRDDELAMGKVPTNFFTDSNSERKASVRELLVEKLGGGESGKKSLQLAEKLAIASLETSVFNRTAMTGNDQLAEIIGLKGWRKGRRETGRVRGPAIHEDKIPGFGTSWLRLHTKRKVGVEEPLYSEDIDIDKIPEGSYIYYCTVILSRYHLLRNLLLDREPKSGVIDKTFLQKVVVYFNTVDKPYLTDEEKRRLGGEDTPEAKAYLAKKKCGDLLLRVWWLAGVVDVALANINLKWDAMAFSELRKAAIIEKLSPEAGTFITEEQWRWIERITNLKKRLSALTARRMLMGVKEKALS